MGLRERRGITLACLLLAALTAAADAQEQNPLKGILLVKGRCDRLITLGQDMTQKCQSTVMNTEFADGRTGFYFTEADGTALTFSGMGPQQTKLDANNIIQPVDTVIFNVQGKISKMKAAGKCQFGNPYNGPAPIACRADTASGAFEGDFTTDGSAPDVKKF
jgi:hypothetical protein